ncbi:MAG: ZPR1 zinc finger domain-containing protein [Thermoproteales archaeon]|nr:ZPR1 zinc finger domain-containing protein [Thermoproteales archaeon]RLE65412.1 MAG: hypothetical protein DRJ47_05355 [Thermoprotei archaeon]
MDGVGERENGRVITEYLDSCPYCGRRALTVRMVVCDVPHIGETLIYSWSCSGCGYTHRGVQPLEAKDPIRIKFKVERPEDLYVKIVRSPYATIRIPEIGFEMLPGAFTSFFLTNVEGMLEKVKEAGEIFLALSSSEDDKKRVLGYLDRVKEIREKLHFTIEIEDPKGLSKIITINQEQAKRLRIEKGDIDVQKEERG